MIKTILCLRETIILLLTKEIKDSTPYNFCRLPTSFLVVIIRSLSSSVIYQLIMLY